MKIRQCLCNLPSIMHRRGQPPAKRWWPGETCVRPLASDVFLCFEFASWLYWRVTVSLSLTASTPATASPPRQLPPHLGGSRGRAVQSLSRGVRDHEILLLLTGAAGAGKSVVLNAILAALTHQPILVIHLSHPDSLPWSQRELSARILGRPIDPRMASPADDTIPVAIE